MLRQHTELAAPIGDVLTAGANCHHSPWVLKDIQRTGKLGTERTRSVLWSVSVHTLALCFVCAAGAASLLISLETDIRISVSEQIATSVSLF
jgi:hypothetical protein